MKKQLLLGSIVGVMLLSNFSYADNLDYIDCHAYSKEGGRLLNLAIYGGSKISKKELLNDITSNCSQDETCGKSKKLTNFCINTALRQIDMRNIKK